MTLFEEYERCLDEQGLITGPNGERNWISAELSGEVEDTEIRGRHMTLVEDARRECQPFLDEMTMGQPLEPPEADDPSIVEWQNDFAACMAADGYNYEVTLTDDGFIVRPPGEEGSAAFVAWEERLFECENA